MDADKLRIFLTVARCGSISEAARRLYVSHSTVSRAVAALEEELGAELFVRSNRSCTLTPAGTVLRGEAEKLLTAFEETAEKVRAAARNT